jgi:Protein of unknown function (DUF2934)
VAAPSDKVPQTEAEDVLPTAWRNRRIGSEDLTVVDFSLSEATAIAPVTFEAAPTQEEIAAEAYAIFEARGGEHGHDQEDWHEAERRLADRRRRG